jgi:hypothetical protein
MATVTPEQTEAERLQQIEGELARIGRDEAFRRGEIFPEHLSNQERAARQEKARLGRLKDAEAKSDAIECAEKAERPERRKREREVARISAARQKLLVKIGELNAEADRMWGDQIAVQNPQLESDRLAQIHPSRFREGVPQ